MKQIHMDEKQTVSELARYCMHFKEPLLLTQEGSQAVVVMDLQEYKRYAEELEEARQILHGIADLCEHHP